MMRASQPNVIFAPLFAKALSLVNFKDKEIADLQKVIKGNEEMEKANIVAGIFKSPEAELKH